MDRSVLARKPMTELKDIASHLNMRGYQKLRKAELIDAIISSGTEGSGTAEGGQQRLVGDDEGSAVSQAAPDEGARKVLPPGARQEVGNGTAARAEQDGAAATGDGDAGSPQPGDGQRTTGVQERADEGGDRTRGDRDRGDRERGDRDRGDRERGDRERADRDRGDRDRGERERGDRSRSPRTGSERGGDQGAEQSRHRDEGDRDERDGAGEDADAQGQRSTQGQRRTQGREAEESRTRTRTRGENGRGDQAEPSAASDDDDDDDGTGRKRRNRRDRRKRNRDRQGEDTSPSTPQPPPSGNDPGEVRAGVLDILPEGYGFLRTTGYLPGERDVYVSQGQIRKHGLRRGDVVQGPIRQQRSNEKVPALHHIQRVNGDELEDGQVAERPDFDELTAIHPEERLPLGAVDASPTARLIDLLAPIGRGQRALIVAPPRSGKTEMLRELGTAMAKASPDSHLMVVLVDERPEEISDIARGLPGEVIASSFDKAAEDHVQIAELALERARRLVELGYDVILLLDSVTRLARAYGVTVPAVGRAIAPNIEAASLYQAKRFFAAARNLEEGGSLTVVATALSDTTSAIDQVILEEFTRVANTLITLDPSLTRRRVHPPIAVMDSGTDNEAALQDADDLVIIQSLRRALGEMPDGQATELLLDKLAQTDSADQLLAQIRDASL